MVATTSGCFGVDRPTKQEDEDFIRSLFEHGLLFAFQTAVAQRQATSSGDVIQKLPRNINFYLL